MRRRALLACVGAASAGCLGRPQSDNRDPTSNGRSSVTTTSADPQTDVPEVRSSHPSIATLAADCPACQVPTTGTGTDPTDGTPTTESSSVRTPDLAVGVDEPGDEVSLDVEVRHGFTEEHPAAIQVVFGNEADEPRTFSWGPRPLSHGGHVDGEAAIFADWRDPADISRAGGDGCWRAGNVLIAEPILMQRELEPGETVTESYVLGAPADAEACLPPGTYRFSTTVKTGEPEVEGTPVELEWALCLR